MLLEPHFHPYRTPAPPRHYQLHERAGTGVAAFSVIAEQKTYPCLVLEKSFASAFACYSRVSIFRLLLEAAAFSEETLAFWDERRAIDEDVASVPLPPVSNSVSPSSLSTSRACSNRCDSLLFWWSRSPSFAWCWRRSLLLPCACHSRMTDPRLLLATTMRSRYASRALTQAPIPAQEYGWAC